MAKKSWLPKRTRGERLESGLYWTIFGLLGQINLLFTDHFTNVPQWQLILFVAITIFALIYGCDRLGKALDGK